jgi:hypothetical protein
VTPEHANGLRLPNARGATFARLQADVRIAAHVADLGAEDAAERWWRTLERRYGRPLDDLARARVRASMSEAQKLRAA